MNETHGLEGGNHVLKSVALELKQKIRGADTLARIGEDKFGVWQQAGLSVLNRSFDGLTPKQLGNLMDQLESRYTD